MKNILMVFALAIVGCSSVPQPKKAADHLDEYMLVHTRCKIASWRDTREDTLEGHYKRQLYMKVCTEQAGFEYNAGEIWN